VGHENQNAIAEFPIPAVPSLSSNLQDLPIVDPVQSFVGFLDKLSTSQDINRITGMFLYQGQLIVNAENWYDATGANTDTTFVIQDPTDLANSAVDGYFQMDGSAQSAGYIGEIPQEWKFSFAAGGSGGGGAGSTTFYTGWSSVNSIISRYSIGPSLWSFDVNDVLDGMQCDSTIKAQSFMNFPYSPDATTHLGDVSWASQGTPGPFPPADPLVSIIVYIACIYSMAL
jgi:hypothetical protein